MAINNLNSGVGIQPTIVDAKGDLIVATGADAVNRLAVGTTANQQLVVDSSTATGLKWGSPSGMVLLNTTSFSAVASQSINDVFSATYDRYMIQVNATKSTNSNVVIRLRVSGADNTSGNYAYQFLRGTGSTASTNAVNNTFWGLNADDTQNQADTMYLFSPFLTSNTMLQNFSISGLGGTSGQFVLTGGRFNDTTSFTGFSVVATNGTITGSVSVFGVNK